jgi:hypothetical protein
MKLGQLKTFCRLQIPGAKSSRVSDSNLEILLNNATTNICTDVGCLPEDSKITVTADTAEYDLATVLTRYVGIDEAGVYWNSGDADDENWVQLTPRTLKWMDENIPTWRNDSSGDPKRYFIEGSKLTLHPTPDTTVSDVGLWVYFLQDSPDMTDDEQFPFGGDEEYRHLKFLDDLILAYVEWKLGKAIGQEDVEVKGQQAYFELRDDCRRTLRRRPDVIMSNNSDMRIQGARIK